GDAPVDDTRHRALRRNVAGAKRSTHPDRGTVEIRFQKHQIHRQDPLRRETTADGVEYDAAARIWFLFQCEPGSRPPALEPGYGTAHRGILQAKDSDVQRLRRTGRRPLPWNGFEEVLLAPSHIGHKPASFAMLTRLKIVVFLACLFPFGQLLYHGFADDLTANPIEFITHFTGSWALIFLLASLSITPLRKITGWNDLIKFRRMLGLFAFLYIVLHFFTFVVLDHFFDFERIVKDVYRRPYVTAGFTAFVLLIPLAVTSTAAMIRKLGKRWQQLHRLVYIAAIAGVIHF